jgi:CTP-dependent riboflavin kinase
MRTLTGRLKGGFGVAGRNLAHIAHLIEQRTGVRPLIPGTLNLALPEPYIVTADAQIEKDEYNKVEYIKLQRCRVGGVQALIMRPNTHEAGYAHGPAHLELLSTIMLRKHLGANDGDSVSVEVEGNEQWWAGT